MAFSFLLQSSSRSLASSQPAAKRPSVSKQISNDRTPTTLRINKPGDAAEHQADWVADQVMHSRATSGVQQLSREQDRQGDAVPESVVQTLASPGRPLTGALRGDMEQRLGRDFSQVQLHFGPLADRSAADVNAQAYTVGQDIVFGAGSFVPGSDAGRRLLAHELTHVVQQSGSTPTAPTLQRQPRGGKTEALPPWTVDEVKRLVAACDGGLGIWAKAKAANMNKDPIIEPESNPPFPGRTWHAEGKITMDSKLDNCRAAQVLVFELTNLSHKTDFDKVHVEAAAGNLSRTEYIDRNEIIERASLVNEVKAFDACQNQWACKPRQRVSDPGRLYLEQEDFLAVGSKAHREHYGQYWDNNYKAAYQKAIGDLYFTFPSEGKRSRRGADEFGRGGEVVGEQITVASLGAWVRRQGADKEILRKRILSSHEFTGSERARSYWAHFLNLHYEELKAGKPVAQSF